MDRGLVRGATLVLPDRICYGGMIWQDGILTEIVEEASQVLPLGRQALKETTVWDMEGDLLIPGLIAWGRRLRCYGWYRREFTDPC